jgi:endonuclease/exonuclease/phosphatase family metal-dependent hydrolase
VTVTALRPLARHFLPIAVALLLCGGRAHAVSSGTPAPSAVASPTRSFELVVLSYNVKSLPFLRDAGRLRQIGRMLAERRRRGDEPDVVLLQEAFSSDAERIRSRAGYAYQVVGTGERGGLLLENPSGLEILSDHPIVAQYGRAFDDCASVDCLVSKSVLGATLSIPQVPVPIRIFTTHMQAHTPNDSVRKNQIDDIDVFLRRIRFGAEPAIFAGDVNFKPKHASYRKFLRELSFFTEAGRYCLDGREHCEIVVGTDGRTDLFDVWASSHDRQYFYAPQGSPVRIEPVQLIRNFTEPFEGTNLSDHWGYEVRYRLSW